MPVSGQFTPSGNGLKHERRSCPRLGAMTLDLRLVLLGLVVGGLGSASFFRARKLGRKRERSVPVSGILLAKLLGVTFMCVGLGIILAGILSDR